MELSNNSKIAVVHDWLVSYAGSERVLEQILLCFPKADIYSLVDFLPEGGRSFILNKSVITSFIQLLPGAKENYRNYLPFMPLAVEQFDLSGYDLIISSSHAVAKGVLVGPNQLHICVCYSPIRYAWDLQHQYLRESGLARGFKGWIARWLLHRIRIWDYRTANGVDHFIAISEFISRRIKRVYGRDSEVIFPPVDIDYFQMCGGIRDDFYVTASRMVPYKRIDLIVEAFSKMPNRKLIVIGEGPEMRRIRSLAGPNVIFMGHQPKNVLRERLQQARAFIFAAEEDFGIAPVEAQACGTPVIAYGRGGAQETIIGKSDKGRTGVFFGTQTSESLCDAVEVFESISHTLSPEACRENAERFSPERFREQFTSSVEKRLRERFGTLSDMLHSEEARISGNLSD